MSRIQDWLLKTLFTATAVAMIAAASGESRAEESILPSDGPPWIEAPPDAENFGGPIPEPIGGAAWTEKGVDLGAVSQGPGPLKNGQTENAPPNDAVCGAVHVVRPHPTNANILYIAATLGGVWRTDNATAASPNWVPLTDQLPTLGMTALEFDLLDGTFNTLIGGTGRSSAYLGTGGARIGLIRSTDGGASWAVLDGGLAGLNVSGVAGMGTTILVSVNTNSNTNTGIYRSINTGQMFTRISGAMGSGLPLGGRAFDLFIDPSNNMVAYTGIANAGGQNGIYRSIDFGQTWNRVSSGAMDALISDANTNNIEIAVGPTGNVFVGIVNNGRLGGFFNSPNGTGNWTQMDAVVTNENTGGIGLQPREKPGGQGGIHFSIVVDPNNPNIVYVGGDRQPHANEGMNNVVWPNSIGATDFSGRLFRGNSAAPAGTQWAHLTHSNALGAAGGGTANNSAPHADSREMAFDANGDIIEGDDGGVFRRTNPEDNTGDWFSIVGDLRITEVHNIAYDTIADVLLTGHQDNGTGLQDSPGSPDWTAVRVADGADVKIDTLTVPNGSIRYWSSQNLGGFGYQTYDNNNAPVGGRTTAGLNVSATGAAIVRRFTNPIELNRFNPTWILFVGDNSIYESFDQGNNLFEVGPGLGPNQAPAIALENAVVYGGRRNGVDNPGVFYVGSNQQLFIRTAPGGPVAASAAPFPGGSNILDVVVNPEDWMEAFVIDADQVYFTPDAGASWQDVTGNLTGVGVLRSLEYIPRSGFDVVVVGSDIGVFRMRTNDPGTWNEVGTNLPNTLAFDMQYDPVDDVLAVATMGRGTWLITLPCESGVTISGPEIVTVCDDAAAVSIEGFAGSCENDPIVGVEWRLANAPVGSPFADFTNTGVATAPDSGVLVHYTIDLGAPGGDRLPNPVNTIEVRAITANQEVTDVQSKEIRVIDVSPMVTVESPARVTVCDDVPDVELHGFAASCDDDPINRIEVNTGTGFSTAGVTLATASQSFVNYVINLGIPGVGVLPASGLRTVSVRAVTANGAISNTVVVTIEVLSVEPSVTIESEQVVTVCDDAEDVELHGFAQSCGADPIARVEFRNASAGGPFISAGVTLATTREGFISYVINLGPPGGQNLPFSFPTTDGRNRIEVRATTVDGDMSDVRFVEIEVLDVDPMVTIEAPAVVSVCDDVEDVELHGFAATCSADPIERVEFRNVTANPAGPFLTAGVSLATPRESFTNYVINLGPPGAGGNLPFIFPTTDGRNRIEVRAVTVDGDVSEIRFVEIEVLQVEPMVTMEAPNPLNVCITDPDVQIQGFVQSCPADPINIVEFRINGGAFEPVNQVATIREGFVSWVLRLGAPDGPRLPINNNVVDVRAITVDGVVSDIVTTNVRWPRVAITNTNLDLTGDVGSGLGVQPHVVGEFTVEELDGFVQTGPIHLALQGLLVPADGTVATIGPENVQLIPAEFELAPGQDQLVTVLVTVPINSSFGAPLVLPPLPSLLHGPTAIRARGECVNPVQTDIQVTVTPYRDPDLIRRGFPTFCGDCAPSHWQMFSFPVVGLGEPYNPIHPVNFGSTLRNQLEDDFGLINFGPAPFHAVRWDPARVENLSFARYDPPKPLLEPTTIIEPGEAFTMARRILGDITMDGYFLNHAQNQPIGNYPRVGFPSLGTPFEGSWDQSIPLPDPLEFPAALQIGNPYAFPIFAWQQAVQDPILGAAPVSIDTLPLGAPNVVSSLRQFNRWVGEQFLEVQGDPEIPALFSPWNGLLRPTEGCFIQFGPDASPQTEVVFNRPPVVNDFQPWPQIFDFTNKAAEDAQQESPVVLAGDKGDAELSGWGFRITAVNSEGLSRTVVVGAYEGASGGFDDADVESIFPADKRPVDLEFDCYIPRSGWGQTGILLRDLCDPAEVFAGVSVPLALVSPGFENVSLSFETIGNPPSNLAAAVEIQGGTPIADLTSSGASLGLLAGGNLFSLSIKAWAKGDLNRDEAVNNLDLFGFSREYQTSPGKGPADLNDSGKVDSSDLLDLLDSLK